MQTVPAPDSGTTTFGTSAPTAANQYLVYIPSSDPQVLQQVRSVIPDAFLSQLDSGERVVQIGRYANMSFAQRQVDMARQVGLTASIATTTPKVPNVPAQGSLASPAPVAVPTTASVPTAGAPSGDPTLLPNVPAPNAATIEISRSSQPVPIEPSSTATVLPPAGSGVVPVAPAPVPTAAATPIGPPPDASRNRYYVIVPSTLESVLQKAQRFVPTARMAASRLGPYIEVQGFPDRSSAEALQNTLRQNGLDARVIYL